MGTKVIFVHGLNGDLNKTWGKFPQLLENDEELDCEIGSYGYDFAYIPFFGESLSIQTLANGLSTQIKHRCKESDEIILVGHSLGGLIIRRFLLNLYFKGETLNIKKICFFAVPQNGSV